MERTGLYRRGVWSNLEPRAPCHMHGSNVPSNMPEDRLYYSSTVY
jgi:hypothetical protein